MARPPCPVFGSKGNLWNTLVADWSDMAARAGTLVEISDVHTRLPGGLKPVFPAFRKAGGWSGMAVSGETKPRPALFGDAEKRQID